MDLTLKFLHPLTGQVRTVRCKDSMTGREVVENLIATGFVSESSEGYDLAMSGGGMLEGDKSMVQNGVNDGVMIRVLPATSAGGVPGLNLYGIYSPKLCFVKDKSVIIEHIYS